MGRRQEIDVGQPILAAAGFQQLDAVRRCNEPETGIRVAGVILVVDPGGKLWSNSDWCLCARLSA